MAPVSILRRIAAGGAGWWRSVPLNLRSRVAIVAVTVPVALFCMLDAARGPRQFAVLYASLADSEATAVREALQARSIPFEVNNGGRTILAPAAQCAELRVEFDQRVLPWIRFVSQLNAVHNGEAETLRGVSSSWLHNHLITAQGSDQRGAAS